MAVAPAFAAGALVAAPTFPDSVAVGDTDFSASLQFTYAGPGKFLPSAIRLTPSCASDTLPCAPADPGVFTINGNGIGGGACTGRTFSVSAPTADGTRTFTAIPGDSHNPTVDPLELPSGGTCVITVSMNVIKFPTVDTAPGTTGIQTIQQAEVIGTSSPDNLAHTASSFDQTTVTKRAPSLSTSAFGSGRLGGELSDIATLSGTVAAGGTMTFTLFGPDDATCAGPAAFASVVPVTSSRTTSSAFAPTAAGTYRWTAAYSGDANHDAATSACNAPNGSIVVSRATPSLRVGAPPTAVTGATMRNTAVLSGAFSPTGTITFQLFAPNGRCEGPPLATSTVAVTGDGSYASAPSTATAAGTYGWRAAYSGDARNEPVASANCGLPSLASAVSDTTPPSLGMPALSPVSFRAARSGPSIAARVGTTVTYTLSKAARVSFRIERATAGRRAGGRCGAPRRSRRGAKTCTRYVLLRGSFTHAGKAGSNRFKFRGRLGGRKLRPGRYRLRALARDAAGHDSPVRRRPFRVVQ